MNELSIILTIITTFAVFAIICITLIFHIIRELRRVYEIGFHLREIIEDTRHQVHGLKQEILDEVEQRLQQAGVSPPQGRSYGKVLNMGKNMHSSSPNPSRKGMIGRS